MSMIDSVFFFIQGSQDEPYKVVCSWNNGQLKASCGCRAGISRMLCKHVKNIMGGSEKAMVRGDSDDVEMVVGWVAASQLPQLWGDLAVAEADLAAAKKVVKKRKLALSDSLLK